MGVAGGVATSGIIYLAHLVRQFLIQRRVNISGLYLSKFQDNPDEDIWTESEIRLHQRGRKIWGFDTHSDGRVWRIEGTIVGNGHICGVYSATQFFDDGVGSFYFKVYRDRLEGVWSGYANQLRKAVSGRYVLERKNRTT